MNNNISTCILPTIFLCIIFFYISAYVFDALFFFSETIIYVSVFIYMQPDYLLCIYLSLIYLNILEVILKTGTQRVLLWMRL